jgi:lipopolysaccharide export system protein LptA
MTSRFITSLFQLPNSLVRAAFFALALGAVTLVHAEKADRAKPMNIEADAMRYNDLEQTSVFTGRVVATKGTIIVRGTRIDVRQDADGYQYGVVTAEPGKLAYYKQKRDAPGDEWIEGEGDVIEYDSRADNVKFIGHAVMRRLLGATVNDETTGPIIVYDQSKDTFTVNGAPVPPGTSIATGSSGRVRALLTPRAAAASAPAAGKPAVAQPPSAPASRPASGAPLRQSTTLGGDQRK